MPLRSAAFRPLPIAIALLLPGLIAGWSGREGSPSRIAAQESARFGVPVTEAYDSWKLALEPGAATDPARISVPAGFEISLLRSAAPGEDSWVALAFDPQGRITVARESKGLLRLTIDATRGNISSVEEIDDQLEECRGLLYAFDALYVNANNSRRLVRLRDVDRDGTFEDRALLLETEGGVGHGRNHLRAGPDGWIYIMHGNDVRLPASILTKTQPYARYDEDQLIPCTWDDEWFNREVRAPAGHVLRMSPDGSRFELVAGGMRNPLDLDFNEEGEMFTFEADMEWDAGAPWYRPNRVLHLVSGGEYGWRRATGKWPAYQPDSLPAAVDIGLASPTGVAFAAGSRFPEPWRSAFLIGDWAYGRIIAVQLEPDGASYRGTSRTFVGGRPLNVTDLAFGPDGAMYFITGGRRTQSGLYRVRWIGEADVGARTAAGAVVRNSPGRDLRELRRALERWHRPAGRDAVAFALPHLRHDDRWIRFAARIALEHQDVALWREAVLAEWIPAGLLGLARAGDATDRSRVVHAVLAMDPESMPPHSTLEALRAAEVALARGCDAGDSAFAEAFASGWFRVFPTGRQEVDRELLRLAARFGDPELPAKGVAWCEAATDPDALLHGLFVVRQSAGTWAPDLAAGYFRQLRRAESMRGGRYFHEALSRIRSESAAALTSEGRDHLGDLIAAPPIEAPAIASVLPSRPGSAHSGPPWTIDSLTNALAALEDAPASPDNGRSVYAKAGCALCHAIDDQPPSLAAAAGPSLDGIAGRFGTLEMLDAILHPSRIIDDKFRHPDAPNLSPMPEGLLDPWGAGDIRDLLAFLGSHEAGK